MAVSIASASPGIKSKLATVTAERIPQSFKDFILSILMFPEVVMRADLAFLIR